MSNRKNSLPRKDMIKTVTELEHEYLVRMVDEVIDKIRPPSELMYVWNVVPQDLVDEIAEDIKACKHVRTPIIVDKDFIIIDGVVRYYALRKLYYDEGIRDIKVQIIVLRNISYVENPRKAIAYAFAVNRYRRGTAETMMKTKIVGEAIINEMLAIIKDTAKKNKEKVKTWLNSIENDIIPNELEKEISKELGISRPLVSLYLRGMLKTSKQTILNSIRQILNSDNVVESKIGLEENYVENDKNNTQLNVKIRIEVIPPGKISLINKISSRTGIEPEKLSNLTVRELKEISKKVEESEDIESIRKEIEEKISSKVESKRVISNIGDEFVKCEVYAPPEYFSMRNRLGDKLRVVEMKMHELLYEAFLVLLDYYDVDTVEKLVDSFIDAVRSRDPNRILAFAETYITYIKSVCSR